MLRFLLAANRHYCPSLAASDRQFPALLMTSSSIKLPFASARAPARGVEGVIVERPGCRKPSSVEGPFKGWTRSVGLGISSPVRKGRVSAFVQAAIEHAVGTEAVTALEFWTDPSGALQLLAVGDAQAPPPAPPSQLHLGL